jgi:glycogen debranching enzyme
LQVENFSPAPVTTHLTIEVGADFRDVFEIRGASRVRRGELMRPLVDGNSLILSYRGLDGELRRTAICFSVPVDIQGQKIRIPIDLAPGETHYSLMTISSQGDVARPNRLSFLRGERHEHEDNDSPARR